MARHHRAFVIGITGLLLTLVLLVALPYGEIAAQPGGGGGGGNNQPGGQTGGQRGGQVGGQPGGQMEMGDIEATAEALSNAALTLEALRDSGAIETAQAELDEVMAQATTLLATAEYLATTVNQDPESIQATVTAISGQLDVSSEETDELLTYFTEEGSVSFDDGVLTVTAFVSEEEANALLDVVVGAAGYDPDSVWLDTTAQGTIVVTAVDVSTEVSGTIVMTYRLYAVDGSVLAELVSVTLDGQSIPTEMVEDQLMSAVDLGVNASAVEPMLGMTDASYSVESLEVTDEGILLVLAVTVE